MGVEKLARVDLRMTALEKRRWESASSVDGISLSEWIRRQCNDAVVSRTKLLRVLKRGKKS